MSIKVEYSKDRTEVGNTLEFLKLDFLKKSFCLPMVIEDGGYFLSKTCILYILF